MPWARLQDRSSAARVIAPASPQALTLGVLASLFQTPSSK